MVEKVEPNPSGIRRFIEKIKGMVPKSREDTTIIKNAQESKIMENTPRYNTTYIGEWNEVPRKKEVISVGDLHGSMRAFEGNLRNS
jgi:hypothetical protein